MKQIFFKIIVKYKLKKTVLTLNKLYSLFYIILLHINKIN